MERISQWSISKKCMHSKHAGAIVSGIALNSGPPWVWYMICALSIPTPIHSYIGAVSLRILQCHLGLKKNKTSQPWSQPPGALLWYLRLHHPKRAPLTYCQINPTQANNTELTRPRLRKDYKCNRKPFDKEFVGDVINAIIIHPDQTNSLMTKLGCGHSCTSRGGKNLSWA